MEAEIIRRYRGAAI